MFPIYFKDENFKEPVKESIYYILADCGLYLVKDFEFYGACVKVEGIHWLLSHAESLTLKFPKIPKYLIEASMGFFYEVYFRYMSEAIILLFFSPQGGFRIGIPEQYVYRPSLLSSSYGLKYINYPTPQGYLRLGTWHSHANLRADHSFVDDIDEENQDGLHIVCGDLDTLNPSFSVSFVVNGRRFLLEKEDVFEGYERPRFPVPERWLKKVRSNDSKNHEYRRREADREPPVQDKG